MRSRLIDSIVGRVRKIGSTTPRPSSGRGPRAMVRTDQSPTDSRRGHLPPPSADTSGDGLRIEYSPHPDGHPDPGEVVWTWVPYEEDPSQGKDRPVVIIGRLGHNLAGVPLTSKAHANALQVVVGRGPWDHEGRVSYANVERLLEVAPDQVRREGAVLERQHFEDVVAGVRRAHRDR